MSEASDEREAIARIIDPEAEVWSPNDYPERIVRERIAQRQAVALAKADAILARRPEKPSLFIEGWMADRAKAGWRTDPETGAVVSPPPSAGVEEVRVLPADFDHLDSIRRKLVFHHALSAHESAALARFEAVARALADTRKAVCRWRDAALTQPEAPDHES